MTHTNVVREIAAALASHDFPADVYCRLAEFLHSASDRELFHANPRFIAARLSLEHGQTLELLVAALHEGLVVLHWEVQCRFCRGVDHRRTSAGELSYSFACPACGQISCPRLDQDVHVTFSIHSRLRILSDSADDARFRQETNEHLSPMGGQELLLLERFRRLFPQQRLLPNESLEVGRVALVFTDLAGSTALYARSGDPRAFHIVRLHFDALAEAARAHGGGIIKTIGDAVMAAFPTPAQALGAALAMHKSIAQLNERAGISKDEFLILKIGIHSGSSLSVTLNDRPDYFGATVNIAARVQGLSQGGDTVITDPIGTDPAAMILLRKYGRKTDRACLKGLSESIIVHRIVMPIDERPLT